MNKSVVILGSTGSIGTQGLQVCRNMGFRVQSLAAGNNVTQLAQQAREFRPRCVAIAREESYGALKRELADLDIRVDAGTQAVCELAAEPADAVLNAVVGIAGLRPTLAALQAGNLLALANKEALVTGGQLVMETASKCGATIMPVDSEHSAIFQCLHSGRREDVRGIVLTASGGPFAGKTRKELTDVGVEQALAHPTWKMGGKITVDSATMMNKGLELMEAMWLFGLAPDQIEIVIHRQSVLHSAVEFADGSVIGQMGVPDMRAAIQLALTWPARCPTGGKRLSLADYGTLTFERPNFATFGCLAACLAAAERGGLAPAVVNGANEQAVQLFLQGEIGFLRIGELVLSALECVPASGEISLEAIEAADQAARAYVLSHR